MLQKFKITTYTIVFFLFVISFGLATTGSDAEAQEGAHRHQSLESQIQKAFPSVSMR